MSRSDRFWLAVSIVLMFGGVLFLGCHHEADGLGCADDVPHCEVQP